MKFLSKMIGAFDSVMLVATTLVMIAPFLYAVAHPGSPIS